MFLLFLVASYAFIKAKYMIHMEEWQLIQQEVMSTSKELGNAKLLGES